MSEPSWLWDDGWSRQGAPRPAQSFPAPALISKAASSPAKDPNMGGGSSGAVPIFDSGMKFADLGSTGLRAFSGWVREEFLPQLVGRQAARVYREMTDNSPTIGAIMFAIGGVIRKVEWRTQPVDDTPAAQEMADFAESLRFDMSHTWEDFTTEWMSMLAYGYAPHEIVYKKRLGHQRPGSATPKSKFDDGRIGWRRLPIRAQDTVLKWFFGVNGEILGLTQQPWVGPLTDLPIDKLLLFRASQHKNNPEGRSILRNAYLPYYYIKRLQEQEAILFERLSGLPVAGVPNALLEAAGSGDATAIAALNAYKKLVSNVRIDEQMGVLIPSDTYQTANGASSIPMYSFKLETPNSGRSNLDANTPIGRYKNDIMTSVLADFLEMGHSARGAQNLAETKVDLFMSSAESWLNGVAAVLNRHGLTRIWDLNGLDPATLPEYVPDMAQRTDLDGLSNFILRMSQAGMPLFPDSDLESYLRDTAGLPDVGEDAGYAAAMTAEAGDDPETKTAKRADLQASISVALARRLNRLPRHGVVKHHAEHGRAPIGVVKSDPGQPRVPSGVPEGGEWTTGGGAASSAADAAAAALFHTGLNEDQKSSLRKYIGEDYQDINSALRKGKKPVGRHAETAKHIDAALKKASLHRDMTLYRGIDKDGVKAIGKIKVGSIIKDKAFVSTSSSLDVAKSDDIVWKSFSDRYSGGGGLLMEISAAKGSKGADISTLADNPGERETLLARNSSFRVDAWDPASRTLKLTLVQ